jgi:hypothetical protein
MLTNKEILLCMIFIGVWNEVGDREQDLEGGKGDGRR